MKNLTTNKLFSYQGKSPFNENGSYSSVVLAFLFYEIVDYVSTIFEREGFKTTNVWKCPDRETPISVDIFIKKDGKYVHIFYSVPWQKNQVIDLTDYNVKIALTENDETYPMGEYELTSFKDLHDDVIELFNNGKISDEYLAEKRKRGD